MKIFLSYNSKNEAFVRTINDFLINQGFEVFFDKIGIDTGDIWTKTIQEGIEKSNAALIFIGNEGIGPWQNKEVIDLIDKSSEDLNYKLIPILLPQQEEVSIYKLPWFVKDIQFVNFQNSQDQYALEKILTLLHEQEQSFNPTNPYKGLKSFDIENSHYFFGRAYDINEVFYTKLRLQNNSKGNNFLAIIGDSGVGKSSFVKAGIMASLLNGRYENSNSWNYFIVKPGENPLGSLSSELKIKNLITDSRDFEEKALKNDDELLRTFRDQTKTWVIYFDQFEEVVAQCKEESNQKAFLNNLCQSINCEKVIVLLSLRSDFYVQFSQFENFKKLLENHNYILGDINQKTDTNDRLLKEIIEMPAKLNGVTIEPELVKTLIEELKKINGTLPVLQFILAKIWTPATIDDRIITSAEFNRIAKGKSIAGIIKEHTEDVFNNLTKNGKDEKKKELLRRIFIPHLVEVTQSKNDVRKRVDKSNILNIKGYSKEDVEEMLLNLSGEHARILQINTTNETKTVEVIHEVIIREWEQLYNWIEECRKDIEYYETLKRNIADYNNNKDELPKGKKLKQLNTWITNNEYLIDNEITTYSKLANKKHNNNTRKPIVFGLILLIIGVFTYNPVKRYFFIQNLKTNENLKEYYERSGGNIDSIRSINLNSTNSHLLKNNLSHLKNLDSLTIENYQAIKSLESIEKFDSLSYLEIRNNQLLKNIKFITKFPNIKTLMIEGNYNLDNLSGIEKLSKLTSLTIYSNASLKSIAGIEKLSKLTSLTIYSNASLKSIAGIEKLSEITSLTISNNFNLESLAGFEKLYKLNSLTIYGNRNLKSIAGIEKLNKLSSLTISDNYNLGSLAEIEKLSKLNSLTFSDIYSTTNQLRIERLNLLTKIDVSNFELESLAEIEKLSNLTSLTISGLYKLKSITGIEKLSKLTSLTISDNESLKSLAGIEKLSKLTSLTISNNSSLKSLAGIEKLAKLTSLTLYNSYNSENLAEIEKLNSLTYLDVSGNSSLKSLTGIEKLSKLTSLTISESESLKSLAGIEKLSEIKFLSISYNFYIENLTVIEKLSKLTSLSLFNNSSLKNIAAIEKLNSLTNLKILDCKQLKFNSFNTINKCKGLKRIIVDYDFMIDYEKLSKNNPGVKLIREHNFF